MKDPTRFDAMTNEQFMVEIMSFSEFGALKQLFIINALTKEAGRVANEPPIEHPFINGEAWKGVAQELRDEMVAKYGQRAK